MSADPPSFEQNMSELYSLKQELLKLHYIFSPQAVNFHQISTIQVLKKQVQSTQKKILSFQKQVQQNERQTSTKFAALQKEKEELIEMNEQLVKNNEQFNKIISKEKQGQAKLAEELGHQLSLRKGIEAKLNKEIDNLKLVHAQELYILRKKQKKG